MPGQQEGKDERAENLVLMIQRIVHGPRVRMLMKD